MQFVDFDAGSAVLPVSQTEKLNKLAKALDDFDGGRLVVHITDMPIKCPVAPLEFTFLADDFLARDDGAVWRTRA